MFSSALGWGLLVTTVLPLILALFFPRPTYGQLERQKREAENRAQMHSDAVERSLSLLLGKLAQASGVDGPNDRISIYFCSEGRFVIVARHPKNPQLQTPGRRRYPAHQGVIGKAWSDEKGVVLAEFPANKDGWIRKLVEDQSFSLAEAESLTMQARQIGVVRSEGHEYFVGVLVFESRDRDRMSMDTLETAQRSILFELASEFVDSLVPAIARANGETIAESVLSSPVTWNASKSSQNAQRDR